MKASAKQTKRQQTAAPSPQAAKVEGLFQQGLSLHQQGSWNEAKVFYEKVLHLQPDHLDSLHLLGVVAWQHMELGQAIGLIEQAICLAPNIAACHSNLGMALQDLKRFDDALASYDRAIAIKLDYADAHNNRGNVLQYLKRLDEALASYDKAIAIKPDFAEAYNNRGGPLQYLRRLDDALASYDKAIAIKPDFADPCNNRGSALQDVERLDEALASYHKAIAIKPDFADVHCNHGHALIHLKRFDEALSSYDKVLALKPDYEFLSGARLNTKMILCDWEGLDENLSTIETQIESSGKITTPFPALSLFDLPALHKRASKIYIDAKYPRNEFLGNIARKAKTDRIRIGYYSADFCNHATAYLITELFETHNPAKVELFGFSFGPNKNDEMRQRISCAFDTFLEVNDKSDREVAKLSREIGIDIAVDLKGFTQGSRPGIFVERCAPLQVNYLGYPGTMGAENIDYVIADRTLIPETSQPDYAEKIVYLPNSYQVNDTQRKISEQVFTKHELGLPETGFVFCCFNNSYKILPSTFDSWMRILEAVEGSVMWLLEDNSTAASNLRREAENRGIDRGRLVFAQRMPLPEHLARHRQADLFIDTLPYNAHTTASDALWAGLPILTCMGQSFASRVAASLLNAIGLPELITHTQEEYEALAIELAMNQNRLFQIKAKLRENRLTTPLFDARLFARHVEEAYSAMYERYHAGLAPDHIYVE